MTMTVAELIASLKRYPDDMWVVARCEDGPENHSFYYAVCEDESEWDSRIMDWRKTGRKIVVLT
jgi:hypothetical protein